MWIEGCAYLLLVVTDALRSASEFRFPTLKSEVAATLKAETGDAHPHHDPHSPPLAPAFLHPGRLERDLEPW